MYFRNVNSDNTSLNVNKDLIKTPLKTLVKLYQTLMLYTSVCTSLYLPFFDKNEKVYFSMISKKYL